MTNKSHLHGTVVERCDWAKADELMIEYHDREWGVPCRDDRKLFEHLLLDCFQAGLSWAVILHKRENFRKAFSGFDPKRVAEFDSKRIEKLMRNPGIVRNRAKIEAAVVNARALMKIREEFGSFSDYLWRFTGGRTIINRYRRWTDVPASTKLSRDMSRDMKKRGFRFTGPTCCYAFMQAVGLVNDHQVSCFRWRQLQSQ
ncbi:MAG: DNA-3-methyladenine glycosylase I [Deltaproteobacteria bacterium]|nr:MAG: DNA-3-methyladenine glycosylase I [Deltaproteobacteria bacterium]